MERASQSQLDYLRGFAAVVVVINHARGTAYVGGGKLLAEAPTLQNKITVAILQLTSFGTEAVALFFVLSGYAMAHSIRSNSRNFYLKRIVRIWPPYIAATLFAAGAAILLGKPNSHVVERLFYFHAHSPLTPQFWSLPYEVLFYALCPFLLVSRTTVRWVFGISLALITGTIAVNGLVLNPWPWLPLNFLTIELFLFACGAMAYDHFDRIPRWRYWSLAIVPAALGTIIALRFDLKLVGALLVVPVAVLAIANVKPRRLNLGFCSYSIYLYHFALLALMINATGAAGNRNPFLWMVFVPAAVLGSMGLYWLTERISNQWVAKLRRRPLPPAEAHGELIELAPAGSGDTDLDTTRRDSGD